jgi:hypothetical protein
MKVKRLARPDTTARKWELLKGFSVPLARYDQITFDGGVLTIGATHTGDMYDVAIAHEIMNGSPVIIWGVDDQSVGKAGEIARFIDDAKKVYWTAQPPPPGNLFDRTRPQDLRYLATGKTDGRTYWIREGGATTIVTAYVKNGFLQLMAAVRGLGLTPVPMGELDPYSPRMAQQYPKLSVKSSHGANLLSYWNWESVNGYGRLAQTRLLRVLADKFLVAGAVGMRSGITDLLCYVGIPTLVIDIHPIRGTVAKGWQRTLKRYDAFEAYKVVSLKEERDRETAIAANWSGAFTEADFAAISESLGLLLKGAQPKKWSSDPADWPQHPAQTAGVKARARVLYENVRERCELIDTARADIATPTPQSAPQQPATTGKRKNNQDELRDEIEAQKARGVAASQTAAHEIRLREAKEEIAHLEEWLSDSFVKPNAEVDSALDYLSDARKRIAKTFQS